MEETIKVTTISALRFRIAETFRWIFKELNKKNKTWNFTYNNGYKINHKYTPPNESYKMRNH